MNTRSNLSIGSSESENSPVTTATRMRVLLLRASDIPMPFEIEITLSAYNEANAWHAKTVMTLLPSNANAAFPKYFLTKWEKANEHSQ